MRKLKGEALRQLPLPDGVSRMETGPIQFGDDWPGMFVRGDGAFVMAMYLDRGAEFAENSGDSIAAAYMKNMAKLMRDCQV